MNVKYKIGPDMEKNKVLDLIVEGYRFSIIPKQKLIVFPENFKAEKIEKEIEFIEEKKFKGLG